MMAVARINGCRTANVGSWKVVWPNRQACLDGRRTALGGQGQSVAVGATARACAPAPISAIRRSPGDWGHSMLKSSIIVRPSSSTPRLRSARTEFTKWHPPEQRCCVQVDALYQPTTSSSPRCAIPVSDASRQPPAATKLRHHRHSQRALQESASPSRRSNGTSWPLLYVAPGSTCF